MDDIRKKIIIIFCAVAGLIVAAFLIIKFYSPPPSITETGTEQPNVGETVNVSGGNQTTASGQTTVPTAIEKPKSTLPEAEMYVKQLTKVFVERFFSYSNQNDNSHIEDAMAMSTAVMTKWLKTQAQEMSAEYQGVTTRVVASTVRTLTDNKAVVGVDVQQEFEGYSESLDKNKTVSRTGRAELVKAGNDWKIDGFFWE